MNPPIPFNLILDMLIQAIASTLRANPHRAHIIVPLTHHLARIRARLIALYTRFRTRTLRPIRTRIRQSPRAATPTKTPRPRFPRGHAWLFRVLPGHHQAAAAAHLQNQLDTPEMQAFLAAAPQAARILRPLCRMLGIPLTPQLRPTTPPPQNAPTTSTPHTPEPPTQKTT